MKALNLKSMWNDSSQMREGLAWKLFEKAGFEVVEVIGKPILPVRKNRALLAQDNAVERLLRLESELSKDQSTAAAAGHLQIVAKRPL